jgi:hypothetical protein
MGLLSNVERKRPVCTETIDENTRCCRWAVVIHDGKAYCEHHAARNEEIAITK